MSVVFSNSPSQAPLAEHVLWTYRKGRPSPRDSRRHPTSRPGLRFEAWHESDQNARDLLSSHIYHSEDGGAAELRDAADDKRRESIALGCTIDAETFAESF
jgi:hypothetical protein